MNSLCARRSPPYSPRATGMFCKQLACSIARVAGCLHTDVSSPWLTHDWSDVRWEFDLRQAVGVGGLTAAAGIAIRSASCQQPRVAALTGAAASSLVSRLSAVVIGLCAVARRRHHPSDLRSSCSSCSSCCQSSTLTRRARIVRRTSRTHAHANSARTWLRRLVAALL